MKELNIYMEKNSIEVELILAKKNVLIKFKLFIKKKSTVSFFLSTYKNIIKKYVNLNYKYLNFGVFGSIKKKDYIIKNGDRIEIYRNLSINPIIRRKKILKKK